MIINLARCTTNTPPGVRSSAELEGEAGPAAAATAAARRPAEAEVLPAAAAHGACAAAEEGLEYLVGVDVLREGVAAPVALQVLQVVAVVVPARMISILQPYGHFFYYAPNIS